MSRIKRAVRLTSRMRHARYRFFVDSKGKPMSEENSVLAQIQEHRAKIDEIDREIVSLLNKRAGHSLVIRGLKPGAHLGLYDARREEEIFERVDSYNEGPLYNENLREIYASILKVMKETPSV